MFRMRPGNSSFSFFAVRREEFRSVCSIQPSPTSIQNKQAETGKPVLVCLSTAEECAAALPRLSAERNRSRVCIRTRMR